MIGGEIPGLMSRPFETGIFSDLGLVVVKASQMTNLGDDASSKDQANTTKPRAIT